MKAAIVQVLVFKRNEQTSDKLLFLMNSAIMELKAYI